MEGDETQQLLDLIRRMYKHRGNCCGCAEPWEVRRKYDFDGNLMSEDGVENEEIVSVLLRHGVDLLQ